MKISHAIVRETPQAHGTRAFSPEKGFDLTYDAGLLSVRSTQRPGRVYLYPASAIVEMWAEDEPPKKK